MCRLLSWVARSDRTLRGDELENAAVDVQRCLPKTLVLALAHGGMS